MTLEQTAVSGEDDQPDLSVELDQDDTAPVDVVEGEVEQDGADDEVVVTIGEESPPTDETESAPQWVKDLRKKSRDDARKIRELEAKLSAVSGVGEQVPALGKRPEIGDDGIDYDPEVFARKLEDWLDKKREVEKLEAKRAEEAEKANQSWQQRLDQYARDKSELKVKDFDDAEHEVMSTFSPTQQGIIIKAAKDPALTVYALGKNSVKAKELAAITDPVEFAAAIGELRGQLKVSNKKAPPPERTVKASAVSSVMSDKVLEQLREEAARTGNYTKVHSYKQQLRNKR